MKPLRELEGRAARRLAEANASFAPAAGEQAAAWARLRDHLPAVLPRGEAAGAARDRPVSSRARLGWLWGVGATAALVGGVWLLMGPGWPGRPVVRPEAPLASRDRGVTPLPPLPAAPAPATAPAPTEIPASAPTPGGGGGATTVLPHGRSLVTAGVRARLAPRSVAKVLPAAGADARIVALERGTLDIEIDAERPPAPAGRVAVQVAAYRLEAEGGRGRFRVSMQRGKVDLVVRSGKLVVWSSRRVVAQVVAGERWTNLSPKAGPAQALAGVGSGGDQTPEPSGQATDPGALAIAEAPDCARLTRRGAIDEALTCFTDEARQPGLVGELALMEVARIRRDVKGDLDGAESALAEHRRRFPHGSLASEAAGARIELLVRLGRAAEGLAESERLSGSDGIFWRGVCLARLGRQPEAASAFDAYLARRDGKHRAEATRMRRELTP